MRDDRVVIVAGEDDKGPLCHVTFPSGGFIVDPKMIAYVDGLLTVRVPAALDLPVEAVTVERWLPPEQEQVYLAVLATSPLHVERLLIEEQKVNMGDSMGTIAVRAVARAVAGDTGAI